MAYSRGDRAAANYEIAWVTVPMQHLRAGAIPGPGSCAPMVANPTVRRAQSRGTWQGSGTWQTTGGGGPGGGLVLAVIAAVVLIGSGTASAVASALVTMAIIIGLVFGGIGWLVYRLRHDRARRPIAARQVYRPRRAAAPRGLAAARD